MRMLGAATTAEEGEEPDKLLCWAFTHFNLKAKARQLIAAVFVQTPRKVCMQKPQIEQLLSRFSLGEDEVQVERKV